MTIVSMSKRKYPSLTLADLFRAHAEECIRAALNQASLKDAQTLLASAQEQLAAADALQAHKLSAEISPAGSHHRLVNPLERFRDERSLHSI
jgi:hypothetical protein